MHNLQIDIQFMNLAIVVSKYVIWFENRVWIDYTTHYSYYLATYYDTIAIKCNDFSFTVSDFQFLEKIISWKFHYFYFKKNEIGNLLILILSRW